jgi:hypothetical protein
MSARPDTGYGGQTIVLLMETMGSRSPHSSARLKTPIRSEGS